MQMNKPYEIHKTDSSLVSVIQFATQYQNTVYENVKILWHYI